jgi:hypothetical protein
MPKNQFRVIHLLVKVLLLPLLVAQKQQEITSLDNPNLFYALLPIRWRFTKIIAASGHFLI